MTKHETGQIDLTACCAGEKKAWDEFVLRAAPIIYAAVRRTVGTSGKHAVDDIAQDVFVRLVKDDYRLLKTYDPQRAALSTWLTLVARSTSIDRLRRRRLETMPFDEGTDVGKDEGEPAPTDGPELDAASVPLHLLTARQRLVLMMLFVEERSVADVARILDVNAQTVRSTKHKALEKLREHASPPP